MGHELQTVEVLRLPRIRCGQFSQRSSLSRVPARATEYFVSSAAQITTAMQTAQPGDILTMTDGTWTNQRIQFAGNRHVRRSDHPPRPDAGAGPPQRQLEDQHLAAIGSWSTG